VFINFYSCLAFHAHVAGELQESINIICSRHSLNFVHLLACPCPHLMHNALYLGLSIRAGVLNSNCLKAKQGLKATQGPHYDVDVTMAVFEPYQKQYLNRAVFETRNNI